MAFFADRDDLERIERRYSSAVFPSTVRSDSTWPFSSVEWKSIDATQLRILPCFFEERDDVGGERGLVVLDGEQMATKESAPQITAITDRTSTLVSGCSRLRSIRGSGIAAKYSRIEAVVITLLSGRTIFRLIGAEMITRAATIAQLQSCSRFYVIEMIQLVMRSP